MEAAVDNLEKQMQKADEKLDVLAVRCVNVEHEVFTKLEVNNLLKSVTDVKNDYQNLRREISEVQDLQKQLSTSLQAQLQLLQSKYNFLKERIATNVAPGVPKLIVTDSPGTALQK